MTIAFSRRQVEDGLAPDSALMPMETSYSRVMRDPMPAFTSQPSRPRSEPVAAAFQPAKPAPPRIRLGRRVLKAAYRLLRPVLRPLAWRMRTFLLRDMNALLLEIRDGQAAILQATLHMRQRDTGVYEAPTPWLPARLRRKVHQFHAGSAHGDAITNAMFLIQRQLRSLGYESEIFVEHLAPGLEQRLHPLEALPVHDDHVLLIHHSMGHEGFDRMLASPAPKLLIYHNITPPALLAFNPFLQHAAERGRRQLMQLRDHVVAAIADSHFNGVELRRLGFPCVREATLLFDVDHLVAGAVRQKRDPADYTVMFVGREVPSKGQADLVEAFACFARRYHARTGRAPRLVLAGAGASDAVAYRSDILARIDRHGLNAAVLLTGALSDADLHAWFGAADLYVSLSRHEGFGVPLVEAMAYGIPVLALDVGAVAATLGEGGVLVNDASPTIVADAMMRIACDPGHADAIRQRQQVALQAWKLDRHLPVLTQMLLMAGAAPPEPQGVAASMLRDVEIAVTRRGEVETARSDRGGLKITIAADAVPPAHKSIESLALAMVSAPSSVLPTALVQRLNTGFDGVLVVSDCERRTVIESGVHIPVHVVGGIADMASAPRVIPAHGGNDFLHIADAQPVSGTDLLLVAWARAFRWADGVRLVIVVPPEDEAAIACELAALRYDDAEIAEVELRCNVDWQDVDVLVQPSRDAADYRNAAQALAAGLHLIATGHGAHLAFTAGDSCNVRLLRHRMRPISDHGNAHHPHALWAEPDVDDLVLALREAHARPRCRRPGPASLALLSPERQAERIAAQSVDILLTPPPVPMRLGWISPWGVRCGIAQYSRHLLGGLDRVEPVLLFCDHRQMVPDAAPLPGVKVKAAFRVGEAASLPELAAAVMAEDPDVLVIQHQAGVLPWDALAALLEHHALRARCVVVALHNARDLLRARPALRERTAAALNACSRVLVHSYGDIDLLGDIGVANGVWLPHGSTRGPAPRVPQILLPGDAPLIGTTGFVLPHKGLQRLIRAVSLLRPHWPGLRLRLVTSRYPDPVSDVELSECEALVTDLGLEAQVEWHTGFAPNDVVLHRLSDCDLLVMPYAPTLESSSGAVRQAIASGVPTLVSDLALFDDLGAAVERIASTTPEAIAARIDAMLRQPILRAALQERAQDWLADHEWSLIGERLQGMLRGLHAERLSKSG